MSYCRWSSDHFNCDVYVYEDVSGGWTCHVAARRMEDRLGEPEQPNVQLLLDDNIDEYLRIRRVWEAWHDTKQLVPIGLPKDGESFNCDSPGDCAELLIDLRELGYVVPQYAIDSLIEEQRELDEYIQIED